MPAAAILNHVLLIATAAGLSYLVARNKRRAFVMIGAAFLLCGLTYWLQARPDIFVRLIPHADAVFFENLYPVAVALFVPAALRFAESKAQTIRLAVLLTILFCVSVIPFARCWPEAPKTGPLSFDEHGICLQTSFDTCSDAAGVTLLRLFDIDTTEAEVARLSLTHKGRGTSTLGLYRALATIVAASGTNLRVEIVKCSANEALERYAPCIITAGLGPRPRTPREIELQKDYNWQPGVYHDVVLLGPAPEDAEKVLVGDPGFGQERWWKEELEVLYQGIAVRIESKSPPKE